MNQYYLGNTLINDSYLGSIRVEDLLAYKQPMAIEYLIVAGGACGGGDYAGGGGASLTLAVQSFQRTLNRI